MIHSSPVRICLWFLSVKGDPVQLHGRLSGCSMSLSVSVLETKELKLNILEWIGFVKFEI